MNPSGGDVELHEVENLYNKNRLCVIFVFSLFWLMVLDVILWKGTFLPLFWCKFCWVFNKWLGTLVFLKKIRFTSQFFSRFYKL